MMRCVFQGCVVKCLTAKSVACQAWETEINERVARLYGV